MEEPYRLPIDRITHDKPTYTAVIIYIPQLYSLYTYKSFDAQSYQPHRRCRAEVDPQKFSISQHQLEQPAQSEHQF